MDVTTLIISMAVLLGVLLVLVLVYTSDGKKKKEPTPVKKTEPEAPVKKAPPKLAFDVLEAIVFDRGSSKEVLQEAVEAIARDYGQVHATTLARYTHIIVKLCRHPNTDKRIIVDFDKSLRKQNPNLKIELDMALKKGLDSRG
jgi:hypothetical protein